MNWVDILLVIALGSGAFWGVGYGFIRIALAFLILMAGVGIAGTVSFAIGPSFPWFGESESEQTAAAFLLAFALAMVAGAFVNFLMRIPMTIATAMVSLMPVVNLLNRGGGLIAGALFGWVMLSVVLIALQQLTVDSVGEAIDGSSFASGPISWIDRYVASIELSDE